MFQERRAEKRFPAREGTCGTFILPKYTYHLLVGQVLDISRGGVCIKYLSNGDGYKINESVQVNMFCADHPVVGTGGIPCKVAYDRSVKDSPNGRLTIRKCGLKYDLLTRSQLHNLECFINACTRKAEMDKGVMDLSRAMEIRSHSLDG